MLHNKKRYVVDLKMFNVKLFNMWMLGFLLGLWNLFTNSNFMSSQKIQMLWVIFEWFYFAIIFMFFTLDIC